MLTVELVAQGDRTRLFHTEQGSYLVGGVEAAKSREHGTTWHVDNLVAVLEGKAPGAFS
jgi:hypothetical protein